ncbi:MAG: tRNA (uridine(34)/cytosine(34)/5-carboxymethylaminomethyluridine(34)-2'-O)-methyltransferase TrmL [Deltaproteobacteria bacterium CG_4_10_14_0_2_um_filter_43_8]|nr:MAG: tRNA (uridine(34)/cytosine(34)/5-carboxymethylaminomethyluridine(34)-2'-O)-methyltransferase TrmL [Deltaproteobacteria bacterium CG11_big_fil_rev_8_21_14_0_20_42_23]PJA19646.1 MAG: tRNA (uridine(34)/cytosine(34)/5-carboxymethylaminomethyluridine(34)-2'-O)-methyltransferase TrmL [Deltaproteobacteria bacterium CG_4_10_14_0_2_um_filter_43_8]PJC63642.1 MAG: tRNA (uridine(34)/cytosine(34)/5-carboxymethylaminomethyluridine(34)-2'-O)-methyltransferase TrmL [Deltaproteobacteria bacterium CG_4_9_1
MKVVLYQPQIPWNTGNIARTCVATNTPLVLVEPLGFQVDEKSVKRAALDYWYELEPKIISSLDEIVRDERCWFFTKHATQSYTDVKYSADDVLVFGSEVDGLPEEVLKRYPERCVQIPMWGKTRCLNLSTSVGIGLYEAYRQVKV